ncbi:MAG TPA: Hsp20/alpha crystallin family protein [Steroidobacteraceae bacterium]|nr:Hsp20/alpha crystallin family protein [Steroidobacteraceae bacterium]
MFGTLRGFEVSLFDEFRRLQREVDDVFGRDVHHSFTRGAFPAIDVVSNPQQVDVYLTAPGIDAKALDISIQQNVLSVTGRREAQVEDKASLHRQERFSGEFRRVITLPEDVDPSHVSASYVDGVVRISVQRREAAKPRQIEIH